MVTTMASNRTLKHHRLIVDRLDPSMKERATESLARCVEWFDYQQIELAEGLRSIDHAVKLWRYWFDRAYLPEHADEDAQEYILIGGRQCALEYNEKTLAAHRIACLGYDPLNQDA